MIILTLDFESVFGDDYSLSKMTTEEYVRDPRFLAHGCGVRFPDGNIIWMNEPTFRAWTKTVDWSQVCVLMQHAQFDSLILSHIYGFRPAMIMCTIAMANIVLPHNRKSLAKLAQYFSLPEKNVPYNLFKNRRYLPADIEYAVGEGCKHDVWLNWEIFRLMMQGVPSLNLPPFPRGELLPISITLKMFSEPVVAIDVPRAEALATRIAARKAATLKALAQTLWPHRFGHGTNMSDADVVEITRSELASREAFADILKSLGVEPPVKMNKKGDKLTFAFAKGDASMKALLEGDDPVVAAVCEAKLGVASTINETRARRFAATGRRGQPVPIYLNYNSTFSGRTGGGDKMNWGNLERLPNMDPATGYYELGPDGYVKKGEIRLCTVAPPGYKIVVADFSQIEARLLAFNAMQMNLVEDFRNGVDIYSRFIGPYYGYEVSKKTPAQRGVGKQLILSCLAKNTIVVTSNGLKRIVDITCHDLLWDGVEWVNHQGLIHQPKQRVVRVARTRVTPNHNILCGNTWVEALNLRRESILGRALETASANLPSQATNWARKGGLKQSLFVAPVEQPSILRLLRRFAPELPRDATHALRRRRGTGIKIIQATRAFSPMMHIGVGLWDVFLRALGGAITQRIKTTTTMVGAVSRYTQTGLKIAASFLPMSSPYPAGIALNLISTARTITKVTSRETCALLHINTTCLTEETSKSLKRLSGLKTLISTSYYRLFVLSWRKIPVYDLALSGPRNRFTILTDRGPLIVHNCGYMSGAKTIKTTAALGSYGPPVYLTLEDSEKLKQYYRGRNQGIVSYWNTASHMISLLAGGGSSDWGPARIQDGRMWFPNGSWLDYTTLRQVQAADDDPEWKKRTPQYAMKTKNGIERVHKGIVTAHITSGLARIIMTEAMKRIAPRYKIALTVYDEIVACVPDDQAEDCKAFMEETMVEPLWWAPGLPLAVEAHVSAIYDK